MLKLLKVMKRNKKETIIFLLFLLLAVMLYTSTALHLPIPNSTEVIGKLLEPIVKPIIQWVKGGAS
jgi:hypothetical protein